MAYLPRVVALGVAMRRALSFTYYLEPIQDWIVERYGLQSHKTTVTPLSKLKRFAKNLTHRFSRNAVLRSIVARVPPLADVSG